MHSEIRAVKDEKSYWQERLDRMTRQIKTMDKYKTDTCRPMTGKKFQPPNKKEGLRQSKLLESGALHVSKAFNDLQRTRKLEEKGEEVLRSTSRKFKDSRREEKSPSPLGQGVVNDNLHPFSEVDGKGS